MQTIFQDNTSLFFFIDFIMVFKENIYNYTNLADLVLSNSRNIPDSKIVYLDAYTDETVLYGDLKKLIRQAIAGFQRIGLQQGDCVCVYSPNYVSPVYKVWLKGSWP